MQRVGIVSQWMLQTLDRARGSCWYFCIHLCYLPTAGSPSLLFPQMALTLHPLWWLTLRRTVCGFSFMLPCVNHAAQLCSKLRNRHSCPQHLFFFFSCQVMILTHSLFNSINWRKGGKIRAQWVNVNMGNCHLFLCIFLQEHKELRSFPIQRNLTADFSDAHSNVVAFFWCLIL